MAEQVEESTTTSIDLGDGSIVSVGMFPTTFIFQEFYTALIMLMLYPLTISICLSLTTCLPRMP